MNWERQSGQIFANTVRIKQRRHAVYGYRKGKPNIDTSSRNVVTVELSYFASDPRRTSVASRRSGALGLQTSRTRINSHPASELHFFHVGILYTCSTICGIRLGAYASRDKPGEVPQLSGNSTRFQALPQIPKRFHALPPFPRRFHALPHSTMYFYAPRSASKRIG